jgi:hypothetical protein
MFVTRLGHSRPVTVHCLLDRRSNPRLPTCQVRILDFYVIANLTEMFGNWIVGVFSSKR